MTAITDLKDFLNTLTDGNSVAIDEGGLTLVELGANGSKPTGRFYEVGGVPTGNHCAWCGGEILRTGGVWAHVEETLSHMATPQ